MIYESYRYLWPPRPEAKIPPSVIGGYLNRGWVAQIKKNGTCTVIFSHGDEVLFRTRHNEAHALWAPLPAHYDLFRGRGAWNVYVAELLHSKTPHIKNHLYLFDLLVSDGVELIGVPFEERQAWLRSRFPSKPGIGLGLDACSPHVSIAKCYRGAAVPPLWDVLGKEDEGIVLKNPQAPLAACVTPTSNAGWQVKVRRATKNYSF